MKTIDWKRKLTSRKWWGAIINFVTMIMLANGATEGSAKQVACIIMAGAVLIATTIAEGFVDASHAQEGEDDPGIEVHGFKEDAQ